MKDFVRALCLDNLERAILIALCGHTAAIAEVMRLTIAPPHPQRWKAREISGLMTIYGHLTERHDRKASASGRLNPISQPLPHLSSVFLGDCVSSAVFRNWQGRCYPITGTGATRLLRITIQESSGTAIVKLEGKLAGPWVKELARIWRAMDAGKAIQIDLCGVSYVDASGRDLLAQMYQGGADFVADTPLMKQVVHEVTAGSNGCGVANATVLELPMPKGAKG